MAFSSGYRSCCNSQFLRNISVGLVNDSKAEVASLMEVIDQHDIRADILCLLIDDVATVRRDRQRFILRIDRILQCPQVGDLL
jgi:hypothetical protein